MAEWSKAVDLRSTIFGCAGSNPAGDNDNFWQKDDLHLIGSIPIIIK